MTAFPRTLRLYSAGLALVVVVLAALIGTGTEFPAWEATVVFAVLIIFSEQSQVTLPNGGAITPGLLVGVAAIVVSGETNSLLGPLIVGVAAGLYIPYLKRGSRGFIILNSAIVAISYVASALVEAPLHNAIRDSATLGALSAIPIALVCVSVGALLVSVSYWVEERRPIKAGFAQLAMTFPQSVPFAIFGVFLGRLYLDLGWPVAILFFVPILLARDLFASYLELKAANEATVEILVRALEAKDGYTAGHAGRVAKYAQYAGKELGLAPWRLERLRVAALMHDIGKLVVPNHLLNKPGKLTPEEFARVRMHEDVSVQMLTSIDFLAPVAPSASGQHSKYIDDDPRHPIEPFIVAVADAYDAMTSTRSYRRALSQEVAFGELRDKSGTQFHPRCVEALVAALEAKREVHGDGFEDQIEHFEVAPPVAGLGSAGLGDLLAPERVDPRTRRNEVA